MQCLSCWEMGTARFHTRPIALAVDGEGELPTEFRLFVRGWNNSENGTYLFDDAAAKSVMAAYQKWGVDLAIDLEHQMLEPTSSDPSARDARGWAKLELRADGSLWAVSVTWTPDGAARLSQKRQRYVSPAFEVDRKTKRITKILNIAITAMPATHKTPALVAASKGMGMDPKQISAALDALIAGDAEKCAELLKGIIAAAAGGEVPADAAAADAPEMESAEPPADAPLPDEEKKAELAAASRLVRLSGKATLVEALEEIEVWRAAYVALEKDRTTLAAERATLESAERKRLCVELIKLGAEFPTTVWADDKATALKPRWTKMPLAELKTLAAEQRAARGNTRAPTPPRGAGAGAADQEAGAKTFNVEGKTVTLSARELAICAETKCEPATFAMLKSRRTDKEPK